MVQTLEAIKGGGGSIKIGTTGTISALMSKELQTVKDSSPNPTIVEPNEATISTRLKARVQPDEASSSSNKTKPHNTRKARRKGSYIVEVVDIKCRMPDNKPWVNPITNRLKKLNFSKLSEPHLN